MEGLKKLLTSSTAYLSALTIATQQFLATRGFVISDEVVITVIAAFGWKEAAGKFASAKK